ncbi:MAG: type II secretion system protein GspK [Xanthomonadaceae bacterium]|nr:type II secretion system protein GspK [Xanthomonadaceae bacterium]
MRAPRQRPHREGFVLILVLAILVALTVLAGTVALVTQRLRDDQLERQREWRAELDMADTRASVIYLLLTQRMTVGGLTVDDTINLTPDEQAEARLTGETPMSSAPVGNEVRLDSSAYRGLGSVDFALQDDRGLLSFNWAPPAFVAERMRLWGAGGNRNRLANLLLDYQDPDDLYRLNSAERAQYLEAGLAPPTNRALTTPQQLRAVLGWREALAGVDDTTLEQTFTAARSAMVNFNTAPLAVLESIPGIDTDAARRIVDARRLQPYTLLRQVFQQVPGFDFEETDLFSLFPAPSGTLRLWSREGGQARVLHWTLTPINEGGAPWREDYEYTLSQDGIGAELGARIAATPVLAEPIPAPQ